MARLDNEDRQWLDGRFAEVHGRLDRVQDAATTTKVELAAHQNAARCRQVIEHEARRHDMAKSVWLMGIAISAILGLLELLKWAIHKTT
jgi:hypothetical protein